MAHVGSIPHDPSLNLRTVEDVAEQTLKTMHSATDSPKNEEPMLMSKMVKSRYAILERIGSGGFGSIFKAYDTEKNNEVAIKVEKRQGKCYLDKEVLFYATLEKARRQGALRAAPRCHYSGAEGGFRIAVFDLMGESLSDLFYRCGRRFSLKCVLMLAQQLIVRLKTVHDAGIVHRDVKPGNFVMGRGGDKNNVYVIDFGLSNLWRHNGQHIPFNTESPFRGTHRYASVNSHMKYEQSRRDDLEAVAYVLIYFLKGGLPWQSLKVSRNKRRKAIGKFKSRISPLDLCAGLPQQFAEYLIYVKGLGFEGTPDYQYCRDLFRAAFIEHQFEDDGVWDWDLLPPVVQVPRAPMAAVNPQTPVHPSNPAVPNMNAIHFGMIHPQRMPQQHTSAPIPASVVPSQPQSMHTPHLSRQNYQDLVQYHQQQPVPGRPSPTTSMEGVSRPTVKLGAQLGTLPLSTTAVQPPVLPKARISIVDNGFTQQQMRQRPQQYQQQPQRRVDLKSSPSAVASSSLTPSMASSMASLSVSSSTMLTSSMGSSMVSSLSPSSVSQNSMDLSVSPLPIWPQSAFSPLLGGNTGTGYNGMTGTTGMVDLNGNTTLSSSSSTIQRSPNASPQPHQHSSTSPLHMGGIPELDDDIFLSYSNVSLQSSSGNTTALAESPSPSSAPDSPLPSLPVLSVPSPMFTGSPFVWPQSPDFFMPEGHLFENPLMTEAPASPAVVLAINPKKRERPSALPGDSDNLPESASKRRSLRIMERSEQHSYAK